MRRRRKLTTSDVSTQTEVIKTCLQPKVILENLSQSKIRRIATSSRDENIEEPSDHSKLQNPSLLSLPKISGISRPPHSYRIFAKPITNNERANSTLVGDNADECHQDKLHATEKCSQTKRVRFVKPGPLSYKQRVMRELEEDMTVPVMLSAQSNSITERHNSLNLETILEHITENSTATPEFDLIDDMNSFNLDPQDVGVQTDICINMNIGDIESGEVCVDEISKGEEPENPSQESARPKTIQMTFKGVTTTITSRSTSRNAEESCTSEEGDNVEDIPKNTRFVKIKAHTVHIHNHFYNSQ